MSDAELVDYFKKTEFREVRVTVRIKNGSDLMAEGWMVEQLGEENISRTKRYSGHPHTPAKVLKCTVYERGDVFGKLNGFYILRTMVEGSDSEMGAVDHRGIMGPLPGDHGRRGDA